MSKPSGVTSCGASSSGVSAFVASRRRNLLFRKLAGACRHYLKWYGNVSYDLHTNGEAFVLRTLSNFHPKVIFDAGANIGEWTIAAATLCPTAEIHAFEISESTFRSLRQNTQSLPRVHCRDRGLSDAPGIITIRHYDSIPTLTTATQYPHPVKFTEQKARVVTGADYAAENGITHIDFLKIDVEGMEDKVLNGFGRLLDQRAIDLVQFEYGRVSIVNRFLLKDFYELFGRYGYRIGKLFPDHVDFREYDMADEDFQGPNFIACLEKKRDYLTALG
jgi:FkbM family methyltransferase